MKVALIPPTPELPEFGVGDMHLILAHLWDENYGFHYRGQADNGAYIILDNSAYELGESAFAISELLNMALRVKARELVMPDVFLDAPGTVASVGEALKELALITLGAGGLPVRPMYVPHGQTSAEYVECLRTILRLHWQVFGTAPFTIGVSRVYSEKFEGGRYELLANYYSTLNNIAPEAEVHLLGWSHDLTEVARIARDFPWVRSIDSSKPFTWALEGQLLRLNKNGPEPERPENYFDVEFTPAQRTDASINVDLFVAAARGTQLPSA